MHSCHKLDTIFASDDLYGIYNKCPYRSAADIVSITSKITLYYSTLCTVYVKARMENLVMHQIMSDDFLDSLERSALDNVLILVTNIDRNNQLGELLFRSWHGRCQRHSRNNTRVSINKCNSQ